MKIQGLGVVFLCLSSLALCGMQQKLNTGQIQQDSLDSTSSNGSIPSIGCPDPFSFDESALSSARIAPVHGKQSDAEGVEQLVRDSDSATASLESHHRQSFGEKNKHDQSSSDFLQNPLLNPGDHTSQTGSEIHNMYVKNGDKLKSPCRFCKVGKHVVLYATLFILGLVHGAVNRNLSGGAWNEHFWKAPWREWEIGAGANALELITAVLCSYCFQIGADLNPKQQNWLVRPLMMLLLGSGQMLGESMPTLESSGWRNIAVNMWVVPLSLWYCISAIRSIRGYYASTPLLNPAESEVSL